MSGGGHSLIESALAESRSRYSWNNWLAQAERPASNTEEAKIERAANMARAIVSSNDWLRTEGVQVQPQGSYFNNTNVRTEADMDLRIQLQGIKTEYLAGVDVVAADRALELSNTGRTFNDVAARARSELVSSLIAQFGTAGVDASGNKAIKVHRLDGSRADCDLVPAFKLLVLEPGIGDLPYPTEGVAIFGRDGSWTLNFPSQHYANGVAKRGRTAHRFKRNVRMLKRLNYELAAVGDIAARLPSFFVECLVYCAEDEHFLYETDDRYLRLLRILLRLETLLSSDQWCQTATEINGVKFLFRQQPWSHEDALRFVRAAMKRMEI